eukprot:TRINITY_DN1955_c2_g1_i1.p1 TRINITY_DN1955_c2_g1~~TRINITY_DN1955_c2_g1_i1.p1  ORF type:complete len:272 (+),score=35.42 TRINITY_DN1955_c2_g1_i1:24-839(+)
MFHLPGAGAPNGALSGSGRRYSLSSPLLIANPNPPLFSANPNPKFNFRNPRKTLINLTISNAEGGRAADSTTAPNQALSPPPPPSFSGQETVFVEEKGVPLEGVIQFEKPNSSSRLKAWGRVALLSGGDVLFLLLFSAIGRFSHGFPVLDIETFRTADPFIAGWFLGAYFLGGFNDDGRGDNGVTKAVIAATKSWVVGIPFGLFIRAATSGHIPPARFILVTMGSTAILLIGWRALLCTLLPNDQSKRSDVYRRGNSFELFELLTSLIRRW